MSSKPILPADEAENALVLALSYLDLAVEAESTVEFDRYCEMANDVLAELRACFPEDFAMPELNARIGSPSWGVWDRLVAEVRGAVDAQLITAGRAIARHSAEEARRSAKEAKRREKIRLKKLGARKPSHLFAAAYAEADKVITRHPAITDAALLVKIERNLPEGSNLPSERQLRRYRTGH